jgi:hypothetical protein
MKTKMWLVRLTSLALVGSLAWGADAAPRKRKKTTTAPEPDPEPSAETKAADTEGPFAPAGKTGKLREDEAPTAIVKSDGAEEGPPPTPKLGMAGFDLVFGFGKMNTGTEATEFKVASFLVGGSYEVSPNVALRLRFPFTTGQVTTGDEAANPKYSATAIGNLELAASYAVDLGPHAKLPIELALALPTASGDRYAPPEEKGVLRHYRINAAAQVARGLEEDALFATHRFGIIPAVAFRYQHGALQTGAFLKIPIMIKAGGASDDNLLPALMLSTNPTVIETVVGGDFYYGIVGNMLGLGARAWLTWMSNQAIDVNLPGLTPPPKVQFVAEPSVLGAFGSVRTRLGFLWPIGGRIGGDQQANGVRVDIAYVF